MKLNPVSQAAARVGGLFLFSCSIFSSVSAEPFASPANIPSDAAKSHQAKIIRDSVIPEAAKVGIPAYPGAVIIRTFAVNDRPFKYEGLPIIELITADDYETVVDYYKKQLPSWRNAEMLSAYYFAQHGNLNFFKPEEPHVGVHKMENYYREGDKQVLRKFLPNAQTLIKVFFAR